MDIINDIYYELYKMGLTDRESVKLSEIRNKDGIYVYRVYCDNKRYVLKYFLKNEYTREIRNYLILQELNIQTIKVYGHTVKSLLLEDLEENERYRLGVEEDLSDVEVAMKLAAWYKELHNKGSKIVFHLNSEFYRETDDITRENIEFIRMKSNTRENKVWDLILDNFETIKGKIADLEETLTYNDFYWTNLVVSIDKTEAFMYDYNLLGVGFRYSDIRNVCYSLSDEAGKVFMREYGRINKNEKIVDEGIGILFSLIAAYRRDTFPKWALESLEAVHNGLLERAIKKILII